MERVAPAGKVYQAGTLSANPIGMRAGLASLLKVERINGWADLDGRTAAFCAQLVAGFASLKHPLTVVREGSIFWIHRQSSAALRRPDCIPTDHAPWFAKFFHAAAARGVYLPPSPYEVGFISLAHDSSTLNTAAWALSAAAHEVDAA